MSSTPASSSISVFNRPLLNVSALHGARGSPGAAGAAEGPRRGRSAAPERRMRRGAAVVGGSLWMGLVPDGRVLPGLTGPVTRALAPAGREDQQRQQQEDRQRDTGEHEDGLGHVHGP